MVALLLLGADVHLLGSFEGPFVQMKRFMGGLKVDYSWPTAGYLLVL